MLCGMKGLRMDEILDELDKLDGINERGLQIVWCWGILRSTKVIYKHKSKYYFFAIDEKCKLSRENSATRNELVERYKGHWWLIDYPI